MQTISLRTLPFYLTVLLIVSLPENTIARAFWEIRDPGLPYFAMVRAHPGTKTSVIYNPDLCQKVGDACGFFREHANAHAHLNHPLLPPDKYPTQTVKIADCWAAKNGPSHEVVAAYKLFIEKDSQKKWPIIGDPIQRAENIRNCAMEANNWSEN